MVIPFFIKAQPPVELYQNANAHYKSNQFDSAAMLYSKLLAQGQENAEVHFNFANTLFKLGELGNSILHYEKALKFSPEDEDVLHNLQLANAKTADKILAVPQLSIITWWKKFRKTFTSTGWGNIALALIWMALLFFILYLFTEWRRTGFVIGFSLLLASVFCLWLKVKQQRCETGPDTAILLAKVLYVKSAPDESSTNLFMVHEGLKVEVKDKVGEWCKVRLADGKVGWVQQTAIGFI